MKWFQHRGPGPSGPQPAPGACGALRNTGSALAFITAFPFWQALKTLSLHGPHWAKTRSRSPSTCKSTHVAGELVWEDHPENQGWSRSTRQAKLWLD